MALIQDEIRQQKRVVTVSELNASARLLLESNYPRVWVEGEISNFSRPRSGHWYFTLKDASAQLRCAMFINRNRSVRFRPADGQQIVIRGRISLYEGRGEFQAIVEDMQASGEGALRAAFDALKNKLATEGLFASERKLPLPALPRHVAIITSRTGAALRDILSVLQRRFPLLQVTLLPVLVQGDSAQQEIIDALQRVSHWPEKLELPPPDAVILARGGGSLEDLWNFNLESVARAIIACPVAVISAVGHETDFTISDFVADLRAPTPSAAAELLVPDRLEWLSRLQRLASGLSARIASVLRNEKHLLSALGSRLTHPGRALQQQMQRIDQIEARMERAVAHRIETATAGFALANTRLRQVHPEQEITGARQKVDRIHQALGREVLHLLEQCGGRLREAMLGLNSASPLNALEHGYAIVTTPPPEGAAWGMVIGSTSMLTTGSHINAHLKDGLLSCQVTGIDNSPLQRYFGAHSRKDE